MKTILILALIGLSFTTRAQTAPPAKPEQPIYVRMLPSQLNAIQQIFGFAFQWLPKSKAPAADVEDVKTAMQTLYPVLVADTTIIVTPKPVVVKPVPPKTK
jgi:hypothetical protein